MDINYRVPLLFSPNETHLSLKYQSNSTSAPAASIFDTTARASQTTTQPRQETLLTLSPPPTDAKPPHRRHPLSPWLLHQPVYHLLHESQHASCTQSHFIIINNNSTAISKMASFSFPVTIVITAIAYIYFPTALVFIDRWWNRILNGGSPFQMKWRVSISLIIISS